MNITEMDRMQSIVLAVVILVVCLRPEMIVNSSCIVNQIVEVKTQTF